MNFTFNLKNGETITKDNIATGLSIVYDSAQSASVISSISSTLTTKFVSSTSPSEFTTYFEDANNRINLFSGIIDTSKISSVTFSEATHARISTYDVAPNYYININVKLKDNNVVKQLGNTFNNSFDLTNVMISSMSSGIEYNTTTLASKLSS